MQKPNIVWIVLDTHRYDRLGSYGYTRGVSPHLDEFAAQSTLFERAIAPAQWTIPSHASMFTGEFPTTHLTTQSGDMLDGYFRTAAEFLREDGYQNSGFCNNPLVGVINNGLKRGFDVFYNYGGAVPSTPSRALHHPIKLLSQVWERYTQLLRRISYPIQNAFAQSESLLNLSLIPVFVPLWTRYAHFKGDTRKSILDASRFIQKKLIPGQQNPHFVFINLLETHLPLSAPEPFINRHAPLIQEERAARDFMRVYNTQALRWLLPMEEPFSELESQALSQMYDAEVAYQDHLLAGLLERLSDPYHRENTAVIILADHGEMLGEHQLMGHGFGVHEELIRVPLMMRWPGSPAGQRVEQPVSTAQVFHTLLDLAQVRPSAELELRQIEPQSLSLARFNPHNAPAAVYSEAYPPNNVIRMIEKRNPLLMKRFLSNATFRAVYNQALEKLVQIEGDGELLYRLLDDPTEMQALAGEFVQKKHPLSTGLALFTDALRQRQPQNWTRRQVTINDPQLLQRLQKLGYLD